MGVVELVLFDPLSEYLQPRLQGYRLVEGEYEPWPDAGLANGGLRWVSRALGLELHALPGDDKLRLWDPRRGAYLPTTAEAWARAEQAEQERRRADAEAAARRALEAEVARLRAELERRAGPEAGAAPQPIARLNWPQTRFGCQRSGSPRAMRGSRLMVTKPAWRR